MSTADSTTDEQWVPFGLDEDEVATYTALREDIPNWLKTSLWNWINCEFTGRSSGNTNSIPVIRAELLRKCERVLHINIGWNSDETFRVGEALASLKYAYRNRSDLDVWRLVDFCLATNYRPNAASLQAILIEAGAAYAVGTRGGRPGLVKRMPDGVVDAANATFQHGNAGQRLATAWEAAFGVDPDPEAAYSRAIKAVEDAAIPVVSPNNASATLGTVIAAMRSGGKYSLPNLREHKDAPTHDVLLSMMQMLWTGQHDRHGGPSAVPVPNVTQAEAEAAVMLAVTLVGWFETGKVQK